MRASIVLAVLGVAGCGNGQTENSPMALCQRYLSCLAQTDPMVFPAAMAAYGPSGACWSTPSSTAACGDACKGALAPLIGGAGACGCKGDSDCTTATKGSRATPHCDATTGACVACRDDSQCQSFAPFCGSNGQTSQVCVQCRNNGDCGAGSCFFGDCQHLYCNDVAGCDFNNGAPFACGSCAPANTYAQCVAQNCKSASCVKWTDDACKTCAAQKCATEAAACGLNVC